MATEARQRMQTIAAGFHEMQDSQRACEIMVTYLGTTAAPLASKIWRAQGLAPAASR